MASKVMVKLPVAPFGQVNKSNKSTNPVNGGDVLVPKHQEVQRSSDESLSSSSKTPEQVRLEQNIRFLQDQHQLMLAGLHGEIEKLKTRNRELQFQLIFGKSPLSSSTPSSPSSCEEETKHKLYNSPKILNNTTPLQIELLEKELGEMKIQLQDQESRNLYLSAIVDEQKKQLERYDRRREKEQQRSSGPAEAEIELMRKLEDAESLIRRLRRENSDLRREHDVHQFHHQSPRGGQNQQPRSNNHRGHRGSGNGHYNNKGQWFTPFNPPAVWQERGAVQEPGTNLPDIQRGGESSQHHHHQEQQYYDYSSHRPPRLHKFSNNNQYHHGGGGGEGRKYRGGHHKGNKPS